MIESTRAPSEAIMEHIEEYHAPDLVTTMMLRKAVVHAGRELDMEKIMKEPSGIARLIWRKIKSLRPEDTKNGTRYMVDGKQTEVRAIRQMSHWVERDVARDKAAVEIDLNKTEVASNIVYIRGKEGADPDN